MREGTDLQEGKNKNMERKTGRFANRPSADWGSKGGSRGKGGRRGLTEKNDGGVWGQIIHGW